MEELIVSKMAENLIGSEIIKLAGEIRDRAAKGERIYNFTIGDFDPNLYPIPPSFLEHIVDAYKSNETNYPPADGMAVLRQAIQRFTREKQGLDFPAGDFLVAGGSRPLIYAIYKALVDENDTILFPVPSWNNNHYTHLSAAKMKCIETKPENHFMPTAADLAPYISEATLVALCSPLNPTGTVFSKTDLLEICQLILAENNLRKTNGKKPIYLMYDQIYWLLTYGGTEHYDPVSLLPEMRPYTVYVDGMSKGFAATGVRVGWAFGPTKVMAKMKSILGHIGAWAPKAEQVAAGNFLADNGEVDKYLDQFKTQISKSLNAFYEGFQQLKNEGYPVDAIAPAAAIYLTIKIDLVGLKRPDGQLFENQKEVTSYLLNQAGIALVPFSAFGASAHSPWYRLSVGTATESDIRGFFTSLKDILNQLGN
ncbi:MAG TPA: aminotransferase class I/II-fold pyridoxal phosphate-dependent enzyme [Luteibaculaceae bacterium]|nr:aminotransferase class I/II-fold pyridoxal phosphate-dependent enzyme [Luteibaculaceae bacterium]